MAARQKAAKTSAKDPAPDQLNDRLQSLVEDAERFLTEGRRLVSAMQSANRLKGLRSDGTCPIFFFDQAVHIALPWADFENTQMYLLARHTPKDENFLRQLVDLVPDLNGCALVDVGAYTGTTGMILRQLLAPRETHLIEPQNTMQEALQTTIAANNAAKDVVLHQVIVDESDKEMIMGIHRPERMSEARYLTREGGSLRAQSIDDMGFKKVGLINLDFNNTKVPALLGSMKTIEIDRPVICVDLTARDIGEIRALLAPLSYEDVRAGDHSSIFLPK